MIRPDIGALRVIGAAGERTGNGIAARIGAEIARKPISVAGKVRRRSAIGQGKRAWRNGEGRRVGIEQPVTAGRDAGACAAIGAAEAVEVIAQAADRVIGRVGRIDQPAA